MEITPYRRKPHYYETDQMAIIHHANFIHWFEEARVDFMEQLGFSYARTEEEGVASPILEVQCQYRSMVRFGQTVEIHLTLTKLTDARMTVNYRITDAQTGELRATGFSRHAFVGKTGRPVSLRRTLPELYDLFAAQVVAEPQE